MIFSQKCPKCNDSRIAGPHNVHGGDGHHVKIDLPGIKTATLDSFTCVNCGYTEFYADRIGLDNIRSSGRFLTPLSPQKTQYSERRCLTCGSPVPSGERFCLECGSRVD